MNNGEEGRVEERLDRKEVPSLWYSAEHSRRERVKEGNRGYDTVRTLRHSGERRGEQKHETE